MRVVPGSRGVRPRSGIGLNRNGRKEQLVGRMDRVSAKVKVSNVGAAQDGQCVVNFTADYDDERNKEWAKYTPALNITMTVLESVVEQHFRNGTAWTLLFERDLDKD